MSLDATFRALEWALRVVLSAALVIHSILDITDPIHGAKSYFLKVEDSIPRWLLPAVGILRAVAAVALFSSNPNVVLGALAYISTLWCGAAYFHVRRKHHPAAVGPAIMFVMLALVVTAFRVNLWFALVGTAVCAVAAVGLGRILVTPAQDLSEDLQEPPAVISPQEAEATARAVWETSVEKNVRDITSNAQSSDPQEDEQTSIGKLYLGKLNRIPKEVRTELCEGPSLRPCREALADNDHSWRLSSGALVFVHPRQYNLAMAQIDETVLHPDHVMFAESMEHLVAEALMRCKNVWLRTREPIDIGNVGAGTSSSSVCSSHAVVESIHGAREVASDCFKVEWAPYLKVERSFYCLDAQAPSHESAMTVSTTHAHCPQLKNPRRRV